MADPILVRYIQEALKRGAIDEQIIQALQMQGWEEDKINFALKEAKGEPVFPVAAESKEEKVFPREWVIASALIAVILIGGLAFFILCSGQTSKVVGGNAAKTQIQKMTAFEAFRLSDPAAQNWAIDRELLEIKNTPFTSARGGKSEGWRFDYCSDSKVNRTIYQIKYYTVSGTGNITESKEGTIFGTACNGLKNLSALKYDSAEAYNSILNQGNITDGPQLDAVFMKAGINGTDLCWKTNLNYNWRITTPSGGILPAGVSAINGSSC